MQLDLEMDPKVSAGDESESPNAAGLVQVDKVDKENISIKEENAPAISVSASASNQCSGSSIIQGEEPAVSKKEDLVASLCPGKVDKGRKSSPHINKLSGKRKVDWTPELHRQFVQAVEQLGVDKAVPSKILEIMGIDCLTRHNVASHLQKYRSQRKHLQAREADAATWSRKRQLYRTARITVKSDANSWVVPTTGFPPVSSVSRSRHFHVWGHPSPNQSLVYMWPNSLASPPPAWPATHSPPPPPLHGNSSFWNCHLQDVPAQGMPCYPSHFPQPSTEAIHAVIGDVLSKPWLPLPLGLKPPPVDSVVAELQRQGISKIPPTCG